MNYIEGQNRQQIQLFATCIDDMIAKDNSVRAIDLFVGSLDLAELGFVARSPEGRPGYHPADLLKLYIYGYMNSMRSSRRLEAECIRNLEVIWLLKTLQPDHNTIARFRKDYARAIKQAFRQTVSLAKNFNLIGGLLIAGDSTKLRAQNSKKNNYNQKKIDRHLKYIENKLAEHETALAQADGDQKQEIQHEIDKQKERRHNYHKLEKQLEQSGEKQISTSDTESRHQTVRGQITEVCYTLQTTVDAKHKLPIDYLVTNENDKKAMGAMLCRAKTILRNNTFTALYDKGYHTGSEFKTAHDLAIHTLVAIPAIGRAAQAPNPKYNVEHFAYDHESGTYTCPQGQQLTSNGNWYKARNYRFKQYRTKACKDCPVRQQCTTSKQNGKIVQRSEFSRYIEENAQRVGKNQNVYKQRQAIVEHPFGTLKRQWGFDYVITKQGKQRASADTGFMLLAYNLKRIINIVGIEDLLKALSTLAFAFYWIVLGSRKQFRSPIKLFKPSLFTNIKKHDILQNSNLKHIFLPSFSYF